MVNEVGKCRVFVAITAHFDAARLGHLARVLRAFALWPVECMQVAIVTNAEASWQTGILEGQLSQLGLSGFLDQHTDLSDPFTLTWQHKPLIPLALERGFTHFVLVEDDIEITASAFEYWLRFRGEVAPYGLLPGLLRTEFSDVFGAFSSSDALASNHLSSCCKIETDDCWFVSPINTYQACYILDTDLMRRHVSSRSYDPTKSLEVCGWDIRARATCGQMFEGVPDGFVSRYVVRLDKRTLQTHPECWIAHVANNYALMPGTSLGKVPMNSLFING